MSEAKPQLPQFEKSKQEKQVNQGFQPQSNPLLNSPPLYKHKTPKRRNSL